LRGYFFAIQGHANTQIQSSLKSRHDEIKKIHGVGWRHDDGLRIASRLRQHGPSF
jgi:adenosylmethionine-8-amino-7-oxononanoate aminotransferase